MRYLAGFDDSNATRQGAHLPNHAIWNLGHLALYNHRAAEALAGQKMPLAWDPEPFAFGSKPADDPSGYPTLKETIDHYQTSVRTLARAGGQVGEAGLDRSVPWGRGGAVVTGRQLLMRMVFHNGTHCGQIVDLRRALGLPKVI